LAAREGENVSDVDAECGLVLRHGWLSHTPAAFQRAVLDRCVSEEFKNRSTVFAEGVHHGGMFGLVAGHIGVWIMEGRKKPIFVHFLRPGSWFEAVPVIAARPRSISLVGSGNAKVLRLPTEAMREIVDLHPQAMPLFAQATAGHLKVAILAAGDLLIRDPAERCIATLLRLGGCRTVTEPGATPIDVDVNQQCLATMANLARTTAGQILLKLEAAGLVDVSYRRVRILAPDKLRAMIDRRSDDAQQRTALTEELFQKQADRSVERQAETPPKGSRRVLLFARPNP
jgi:CRP-like cAMP-binding protein